MQDADQSRPVDPRQENEELRDLRGVAQNKARAAKLRTKAAKLRLKISRMENSIQRLKTKIKEYEDMALRLDREL